MAAARPVDCGGVKRQLVGGLVALSLAAIVITVNFIVDLFYLVIDPRLRQSS